MQLRKLKRILSNIEKKYGDRIQVSINKEGINHSPYTYTEITDVGVAACHYEDKDGFLKDNETFVVSLGIECPNYERFK